MHGALDLYLLHTDARRYYLPAYLHAMTDPENLFCYLSPVLNTPWFEDEYEDHRRRWEVFVSLLTDPQKRCIAHFLAWVLENTTDDPDLGCAEVDMEAEWIEYMLEKYWKASL